jgi:hypothetical protein
MPGWPEGDEPAAQPVYAAPEAELSTSVFVIGVPRIVRFCDMPDGCAKTPTMVPSCVNNKGSRRYWILPPPGCGVTPRSLKTKLTMEVMAAPDPAGEGMV